MNAVQAARISLTATLSCRREYNRKVKDAVEASWAEAADV